MPSQVESYNHGTDPAGGIIPHRCAVAPVRIQAKFAFQRPPVPLTFRRRSFEFKQLPREVFFTRRALQPRGCGPTKEAKRRLWFGSGGT